MVRSVGSAAGRVVGPGMLGIAAAHLLRDRRPAAAPEAGQVARRLDRPAGGRGQAEHQRHLPPAIAGCSARPNRACDPDGRRSGRPRPHSRSRGGCRPAFRNGGARAGRPPCGPPSRAGRRACRQRRRDRPRRAAPARRAAAAAIRRARRASASSERSGNRPDRDARAKAARRRSDAGGLAPRQQVEAVRRARLRAAPPRSRPGSALAVLAAREQDRAQPAAVRGADARRWRDRRRHPGAGLDPVGEQRFDLAWSIGAAERMRAPAAVPPTSATASHCSRASGEAGSSRKPRPPTLRSSRAPSASRRFATRSGKARATQAPAAIRGVRRLVRGARFAGMTNELQPPPRQPARRLGAPALSRRASAAAAAPDRRRCRRGRARTAAPPPRPRSRPSRAPRPRSAYGRGAAAAAERRSARPCGGRAAVLVERAEREQPLARLVDRRGGRRIEPAQARADRRRPRARSRAAARERSASRISGGSKRGRLGGRRFLPQAVDACPAPAARRGRRAGRPRPGWRAR